MLAIASSKKFTKAQTKSDGDFHFFRTHTDITPTLYDAKKKILEDFLDISAQANKIQGGSDISPEDFKTVMEAWSSGKDFNQALDEKLVEEFQAKTGEQLTGGSLVSDFRAGMGGGNLSGSCDKWMQGAGVALEKINNLLTIYAQILQESEKDAKLATVITAMTKKTSIQDSFANGSTFTQEELKKADASTISHLRKLDEITNELIALSAAGKRGDGVKVGGNVLHTPLQLIKGASTIFRSLSGEGGHEVILEAAANKVSIETGKLSKSLEDIFKASGGRVIFTAQQEYEKKQITDKNDKTMYVKVKPDVTITASSDNVKFIFHSSAKLRVQLLDKENKSRQKRARLSSSVSVGELLSMAVENGVEGFEQALGWQLYKPQGRGHTRRIEEGDFSPMQSLWEDFKRMSSKLAFIRAFVGTGQVYGDKKNKIDWNTIIVVNDRVYSFYEILRDIEEKDIVSNTDYYKRADKELGSLTSYSLLDEESIYSLGEKENRVSRVKEQIKNIYETKYHISIDLYKLSTLL